MLPNNQGLLVSVLVRVCEREFVNVCEAECKAAEIFFFLVSVLNIKPTLRVPNAFSFLSTIFGT